jgi:chromosome segregation ATPase
MTQAHLASLQEMLNTSNAKIKELEDKEVLQEKLIGALSHNIQHHENVTRAHKKRIQELVALTADHTNTFKAYDARLRDDYDVLVSHGRRLDEVRDNNIVNGDAIRANDILYGEWLDKHGQRLEGLEALTTDYDETREALRNQGLRINALEVQAAKDKGSFETHRNTLNTHTDQLGRHGKRLDVLEETWEKSVKRLNKCENRLDSHWDCICSIVLRADGVSIELGRDRGEIDELESKAEGLRLSIAMTDSVVKDLTDNKAELKLIDSQAHRSDHSEIIRRLNGLEANDLESCYKAPTAVDCQPHGRYTDLMKLANRVADNPALGIELRRAAQDALNVAKGGV